MGGVRDVTFAKGTAAAARPDATVKFQLDPASKGAFTLEAKDDGLVLCPAGGLMLIIR